MDKPAERVDLRFNLILFAVFGVIALGGYFAFQKIRAELLDEQIKIHAAKTDAVARSIDRWLVTRKTEVSTLANTPLIRSMDWAQAGPFLKAKHEQMPWFYIFAHINPDGSYYNSKVDFAKGQNLSDRAHFKAALAGRVYASDPVNSRTLNADIVAVTSPIYRSDAKGSDIIGVFGGMIDTSTIVQELSRFSHGPRSYAFAINSSGIAIAHPDAARRGNINTKEISLLKDSDPGLKAIVEAMLERRNGWLLTTVDGQEAYASFTPIAEANWTIATVADAQFMRGGIRIVDYLGIAAFAVLCLIALMVVRFRRLELATLKRQREAVEEKSRAKSAFLASMSHELRTPLNGILGYTQILLQREGRDDTARRHLQVIQSSGQHLLSLINRILDLSKIEAGKVELEPRPVDLPSLLQDLVRIYDIEKARFGAAFTWHWPADLSRVVVLDPEKLKQIVTNVVVNAFKYGNRSEVRLSVQETALGDRPALAIEVSDGGLGMSAAQLERAFTPFEQVNKGAEGAGLGLAIVKELTQLMGGTVAIDSAPGRGTRVRIALPYERAEAPAADAGPAARGLPAGVRQGRPRVLVVDDNPTNVSFLVDLLGMSGFEVSGCPGVEAALELYEAREWDLVLTDLVMPGSDGFELIRRIRGGTKAPDTPIIVLSASAFPGDQVRSMAIGANAFLAKPVDSLVLLHKIAELLRIDYVDDGREAQSATPAGADDAASSLTALRAHPQAPAVLAQIRSAAELGQILRIEALLAGVADPALQRALRSLLGTALREQDADLVLHGIAPLMDGS
jgi:signal transduction histidine kinase/DNA-binding response OmpR family regulator